MKYSHCVLSPLGLFYYSNVREMWAYSFWTHQLKAFQCQVLNSAFIWQNCKMAKWFLHFQRWMELKKKKKELFCWVIDGPFLFRTLVLHYISKYLQTWEAKQIGNTGFFCFSDLTWNWFWYFEAPKIAILTIWAALNFAFLQIWSFQSLKFFQKSNSKPPKLVKWQFLTVWNQQKIDFTWQENCWIFIWAMLVTLG